MQKFILLILILILINGCLKQPSRIVNYNFDKCDINHDKICDSKDLERFNEAFGKCLLDKGYDTFSDYDGNGCVDEKDRKLLFTK